MIRRLIAVFFFFETIDCSVLDLVVFEKEGKILSGVVANAVAFYFTSLSELFCIGKLENKRHTYITVSAAYHEGHKSDETNFPEF